MLHSVMIVDDEPLIRDFIVKVLEINKLQTLVAESGEEAIELFKEHIDVIELVMVDMNMPGIGGIELIQSMLALKPGLRVGLMSGYDEAEMRFQSGSLPIAGYIHKPFRMQEIMDLVQPLI